MNTSFSNVYDDQARSEAYATLEFPGTYYLAYRDLPVIIGEHVLGRKAIDFGCGAGRSTRFLRELGFEVVGVDISEPMLARARDRDPKEIIVWFRMVTLALSRPTPMTWSYQHSPSTTSPRWRRRSGSFKA